MREWRGRARTERPPARLRRADSSRASALPADPALKERKEFRVIGTAPARFDSPAKVDGSAVFGADVRVPGMLYARSRSVPCSAARPRGFDPATALKVPGVVRVERVGDGVAVLAKSTWAAFRGCETLRVTWDEGPLATLDSAAIRAKSRSCEAARSDHAQGGPRRRGARGPRARSRPSTRCPISRTAHGAMNCTARVRPGACEVWVPTQSGSACRRPPRRSQGSSWAL